MIISLSMLMAFSFANVNVGTLYRQRYAFIMVFIVLGLLAFVRWIKERNAGMKIS